jgi:hypothetical protein
MERKITFQIKLMNKLDCFDLIVFNYYLSVLFVLINQINLLKRNLDDIYFIGVLEIDRVTSYDRVNIFIIMIPDRYDV